MNKFSNERVKGFLHTKGLQIVNGEDEVIVLRGWGAGNWMNPEGFMIGGVPLFDPRLKFEDFTEPRRFERGRSLESTVRELCGTAYAKDYFSKWTRNYLTEGDFKLMARLGYNSVRLPISARLFLEEEPGIHWIEEGFDALTQVLDWCEKYKIYAMLDMHGAPGGQSGLACDDGIDNRPHMLTEPETRERAMLLWEEFAKRYQDRWIIGGYDLINEPLSGPDCRKYVPDLKKFYDDLVPRIRRYDKNHMLTIEGAVFSRDMDVFDHNYDPEYNNWCMHVHIYNFATEVRELYRYLDSSVYCGVPIWIGEGGSKQVDNSLFYEIAAKFDIGYSIWAWKKADDPVLGEAAPVKHKLPEGWEPVRAFINDGGPRPSYAESQKIFDEYLENIKIENCTVDYTYNHYNLRQPGITLPGVGFDYGSGKSNGWIYGNVYSYRTEEGMKLVRKPGVLPPQNIVVPTSEPLRPTDPIADLCLELRTGEQVSYTIRDVKKSCPVSLSLRPVGKEASTLKIRGVNTEGKEIIAELSAPFETTEIPVMVLSEGEEWQVIVTQTAGSSQIDAITFAGEE